jgi:uracil-DNA glycosylase family 4
MTISARQLEYLDTMGVQVWQERGRHETQAPDADNENLGLEAESLAELHTLATDCQRCDASTTRKQVVFGDGPVQADWLIVGDFPSEEDDFQGRPFTSNAARLLSEMLLAIGIKESDSYLTNSVKCYAVSADSGQAALSSCRPYLLRQIELVNPAVILVLGEQAAQSLLKSDGTFATLIGKAQRVDDISPLIVVTHHPRYLLESPLTKAQAWDAMQLASNIVNNRHVG